jgi:hypothetical protein
MFQVVVLECTSPVTWGFSDYSSYQSSKKCTMKMLSNMNKGSSTPKLKEGLKDLRDRTPCWMWNEYKTLDDENLINKVS